MKLIIGLGNPGKKYLNNRHNVGFMAIDHFAKEHEIELTKNVKFNCYIANFSVGSNQPQSLLALPQTFMNQSGESVMKLVHFYRLAAADVLIVYDELALPFGTIRTRLGGTSAGHNGIESVIEAMGDNFNRLRIGIANKHSGKDAATFVLSDFQAKEAKCLNKIFAQTNVLLEQFINEGKLSSRTLSV